MYARIINDEILEVGTPTFRPIYFQGRTWDCRFPPVRAEYIIAAGWVEVVDVPRPADTATHTTSLTHELVLGVPTQVWTSRPWTQVEIDEKAALAVADAKAAEGQAILDAIAYTSSIAHTNGAAWVQPVGAHDAYAKGVTVTHNAKTWESLIPANVWAPGVSGWREVVTEGHPTWVQPTGAHDAYALGAIVTHNAQDWISTVADNVWEPGVFGWNVYTP